MSNSVEEKMATAVEALKTVLANLDQSSTENVNEILRHAEALSAKSRSVAARAESTAKFKVIDGKMLAAHINGR